MSRFLDDDGLERAFDAACEAVTAHRDAATPYSGAGYADLAARLAEHDPLPEKGTGLDEAVADAADLLHDSVNVSDPACCAHLQCPPLTAAVAADAMAAATNQSLDSFDQAPAATALEERLVDRLCETFGYSAGDGVVTGGATESNLEALLLARDASLRERGVDPKREGIGDAGDLRVLCSAEAHFTAGQAVHVLGLGEDAVVEVATDEYGRMAPAALDATLADCDGTPFALVATAGTTDLGAIDPLPELAERAAEHDLWLHVDAAYGGALAFSETHADRLDGVERADSLALDFHKLLFQPLGCGAFLVREADRFGLLARNTDYLNPEGAGVPNLVEKSLRTSRRFDALKPYVSFRSLGQKGLAACIDAVVDLAGAAAERVRATPDLELARDPRLTTVVFRYTAASDPDAANERIRKSLFADGEAVVARTRVDGDVYLKLTLLNPTATLTDVESILDAACERGRETEVDA